MLVPTIARDVIGRTSLDHLRQLVAVDSQSNEWSDTIPSTDGQRTLAEHVAAFFAGAGALVEHDAAANVIAHLPGRGAGAGKAPVALMVHLDTSRGTEATGNLNMAPGWDGTRLPFPANPQLCVDLATYPELAAYVGHDVVFGPGRAPFGLDNKLGLAHLMTLARLLAAEPAIPHPPLFLVARPDEEIGRHAAVAGLAAWMAAKGVALGYTVDGLLPFEVNVENFNAARITITFPDTPLPMVPGPVRWQVLTHLGGVNTHGATAMAEGYRAATRLAAQLLAQLTADGQVPAAIVPAGIVSDSLRDCDAEVRFIVGGADDGAASRAVAELGAALVAVVEPHEPRGASWAVAMPVTAAAGEVGRAALDLLAFVNQFLSSEPGFVLLAEDSDGFTGYSNPYRVRAVTGGLALDVRLRDFTDFGLAERARHVRTLAERAGLEVEEEAQYVNMGPRVADRPELVAWPVAAAAAIGRTAQRLPIRGGTGVDPFLDLGIPVANLGTGYFAPESEKELTSLQLMAEHALWLVALVQLLATELPAANYRPEI